MSVLAGFARGMARGLAERSRQQMEFKQQVDLIGLQFAKEQKKEREKRERNRDAMVALGKQNGLTEASINNLVAAKNGGQTAEQIEKLVLRLQKQEKLDAAEFEKRQKEHRALSIGGIANFDVNDQRMGASGKARLSRAPVQSPSGTAEYPSMVGEGEAVLQKTALARSQEKGQRDKDALSAADQSSLLPSTIALYEKQNKIGTTGAELTRQDEIDEIRNRSSFVGPFDPDKLKGKYDESSRRIGFAGTAMSDDTIAAIKARNKDDYSQMLGSNSNLLLEVSKNNDSIKIVNSPFYNKNSDSLLSKISVNAVKTNDPKFNSSLNFVQNNLSLGDITQEDQLNILGKVLRPYNYKERLDSPDFAAGDEARKRAELEKSISIASSADISDSKGKLEFVSEEEGLARNKRISERMKTEVPEAGERAANQTMAMLSESQAPFREDFITDSELEELGFSNYEEYRDSFELELKTAAKQELLNNTGLKTQFVQEKIDEKYQQYFERQKLSAPLARAKTLLAITAGDSFGDAYDGTDESLNSLMKLMPKSTVEAVKKAFSNSEFGIKPEAELTKSGALATDTRPLYVENTKTTEEILEDEAVRAEVDENSPEEFMGTSTFDLELARAQRKDLAKRQAETSIMDAAGTAKKQFTFAAFDKNRPTTVNDLTVLAKEKPESIAASLVENLSLPFADAGFTVLDPVIKSLSIFDPSKYVSLSSKNLFALENSLSSQITLLKNAGLTEADPDLQKVITDLAGVQALRQGKLEYDNVSGEKFVLSDINGMNENQVAVNLIAQNALLARKDLSPEQKKLINSQVVRLDALNDAFLKNTEANSTKPTEVFAGFAKKKNFIERLNYYHQVQKRVGVADSTLQVLQNSIHNELQFDPNAAGGYKARINGYTKADDLLSIQNDLSSLNNLKEQLETEEKTGSPLYKYTKETLSLANNTYGRLLAKFPFEGKDLVTSIASNTVNKDMVLGLKKQLKDLKVTEANLINNATGQVGEMAIAQNMPKLKAVQDQIKLVTKNINELEPQIEKTDKENTARLLAVSQYEASKRSDSSDPTEERRRDLLKKNVVSINGATSKIVRLEAELEKSNITPKIRQDIQREITTTKNIRNLLRQESARVLEDGLKQEKITVITAEGQVSSDTVKNAETEVTISAYPDSQEFIDDLNQQKSRDNQPTQALTARKNAIAGMLPLGKDLIELTSGPEGEAALTNMGSVAEFVNSQVREFKALTKFFSDTDPNYINQKEVTYKGQTFRVTGEDEYFITETQVEKYVKKAETLGNRSALVKAKLLLFTFRLGLAEGQSGNAMSNKDFDRLINSVRVSGNPAVFQNNIRSLINDKKNTLNTAIKDYNTKESKVTQFINTLDFNGPEEEVQKSRQRLLDRNSVPLYSLPPEYQKVFDDSNIDSVVSEDDPAFDKTINTALTKLFSSRPGLTVEEIINDPENLDAMILRFSDAPSKDIQLFAKQYLDNSTSPAKKEELRNMFKNIINVNSPKASK